MSQKPPQRRPQPPTPNKLKALLEGFWQGVPFPQSDDDEDDFSDALDEMEIYIVQDPDMPMSFVARYRREEAEGEMDIRIIPPVMMPFGRSEEPSFSLLFTFVEDNEDDDGELYSGAALAALTEADAINGVLMLHMGEDIPFVWKRVQKEVPEEIKAMIVADDWFGDDEEYEDEPAIILQGLNELLGGFIEEAPEDASSNDPDPRELVLGKSLEEFLLYQEGLIKRLESGGIKTVETLLDATDDELLSIKGIGPNRLIELRRLISAWGVMSHSSDDYKTDHDLLDFVFRFRVSLDWEKGVWRDLDLLGSHSMHDLHLMIQEAFGWDDDHLYAFYMSGRYWDGGSAIEHPHSNGDVSATDVLIAGLGLMPGQRFVYLFDFGDELRHRIKLVSIGDEAISPKDRLSLPCVSKSQGEAPPQYDWDEWDEEEWDE